MGTASGCSVPPGNKRLIVIAFSLARRARDAIADATVHHARLGFRRSLFERPELHDEHDARKLDNS